MRKYLIAYPIWNKQDMIGWLMDGIAKNIDPLRADILFLINAEDRSEAEYYSNLKKLKGFRIYDPIVMNDNSLWEHHHHNILLKYFLDLDQEVMIVPQDDNYINGPSLIHDLDGILDEYGDKIGLIGGRDGYGFNYSGMISSPFSESARCTQRLAIGCHAKVTLLNTGPLVYPRSLVEKNGFWDIECEMYGMDDYAARSFFVCKRINIILGMDILHQKYGTCKQTIHNQPLIQAGIKRFREKYIAMAR